MEISQDLLASYEGCQVQIVTYEPRQEWVGEVKSVDRLRQDKHDNGYIITMEWKVTRRMPDTAWEGCRDASLELHASDYSGVVRIKGDLMLNAGRAHQRIHFYSRGAELIDSREARSLAARPLAV